MTNTTEPVNKKKDRNADLIKDYLRFKKEGRSMVWLVSKYQISSSNIYRILKAYGVNK